MNDLDAQIFRTVQHALSGGWLGLMVVLSAIGGGWACIALVPLFASARLRPMAVALALVLGANAILVFSLKRLVRRMRPAFSLADVKALVFEAPTDFSFPSGHSAGSFAVATFVAIVLTKGAPVDASPRELLVRRALSVGLVLVAVGVALSRIALGVHFPTDVTAGALIGSSVAAVGANLHLRRRRARETAAIHG